MGNLKKWDWIATVVFALGGILFACGCVKYGRFDHALCCLGLLLVLIGIVIGVVTLRCPCCHHYLGICISPKKPFCPFCGSDLTEEETDT